MASLSSVHITACAELVKNGDPDRFLAAMSAPPAARTRLFVLFAFNLEIARAPFMSNEPMVALIRLQFWRDLIEAAAPSEGQGREIPNHDVATPLSQLILAGDLSAPLLCQMIDARETQCHGAIGPTFSEISAFTRASSGALIAAAVGPHDKFADAAGQEALFDLGEAMGIAGWLLALPDLVAMGRGYLMPEDGVIKQLAQSGLQKRAAAQVALPAIDDAALRSTWRTSCVLKQALNTPERAMTGQLNESELSRRFGLLWRMMLRRW